MRGATCCSPRRPSSPPLRPSGRCWSSVLCKQSPSPSPPPPLWSARPRAAQLPWTSPSTTSSIPRSSPSTTPLVWTESSTPRSCAPYGCSTLISRRRWTLLPLRRTTAGRLRSRCRRYAMAPPTRSPSGSLSSWRTTPMSTVQPRSWWTCPAGRTCALTRRRQRTAARPTARAAGARRSSFWTRCSTSAPATRASSSPSTAPPASASSLKGRSTSNPSEGIARGILTCSPGFFSRCHTNPILECTPDHPSGTKSHRTSS
mmetsp:Transcript_11808/g.30270  ORF Transcript_11808/g.30270 Transcript_11808/m.30270 type:complete len:259 (-) Transcript_11808:274-1050(-)